jgi:hypothetical protein
VVGRLLTAGRGNSLSSSTLNDILLASELTQVFDLVRGDAEQPQAGKSRRVVGIRACGICTQVRIRLLMSVTPISAEIPNLNTHNQYMCRHCNVKTLLCMVKTLFCDHILAYCRGNYIRRGVGASHLDHMDHGGNLCRTYAITGWVDRHSLNHIPRKSCQVAAYKGCRVYAEQVISA